MNKVPLRAKLFCMVGHIGREKTFEGQIGRVSGKMSRYNYVYDRRI